MSEEDKESLPEEVERIAEEVGETLEVVEEVDEDGIASHSLTLPQAAFRCCCQVRKESHRAD